MKNAKDIILASMVASTLGLLLPASNASALGIVSRSCIGAGAQESITIDWGFNKFVLWTASSHYREGVLWHTINTTKGGTTTGWEYTYRSYAGHLGSEFWTGSVMGYHYRNDSGWITFLGNSNATDCNLANWG